MAPYARHDGDNSSEASEPVAPRRGAHRRSTRTGPARRLLTIPLAVGAVLAAGSAAAQAAPGQPRAEAAPERQQPTVGLSTAPQVLQLPDAGTDRYVDQLQRAAEREAARLAAEAAERQREAERLAQQEAERLAQQESERIARELASRPSAVFPTVGALTSGFGPRWGTAHNGIDIANAIGTPIKSVTDGTVIESGPASGFGLWVRIQQDDGTIGVYGHINESLVSVGQQVRAGDVIATMGNRGQSTGPHLHFEVWQPGGAKMDPMAWFGSRGISVPQASRS
ncbi:Peptidase M23 [Rhodococcus rhodochrous ATCC 21198]|nr:Peptidase M23 [Rhodococcus rhodochrous ATCC 21198]NCL75099.1 hypothetical protein [Rhodococcus sp. YH1]